MGSVGNENMSNLSKLQKVELEILTKFSKICESENLTWFAMFGTLLGAARHSGFIPWDEDIDVAMPRPDYDRLRAHPELFKEPYFLQTPQNDPAAASHFMRLRRSDTTMIKRFNGLTRGGHLGACIDIMPLDEVPDVTRARTLHAAAVKIQKQMLASAALEESANTRLPAWKAMFCYGNGGIAGSYHLFAERYEWLCSMYSGQPYYSIPVLSGANGSRMLDKGWFSSSEMMKFENIDIPVPLGWREVLVACYPNGLHEPNIRDRRRSEAAIVDMDRPFEEHLWRFTDMLKGVDGKKILVFGAGDSLMILLERYGSDLDIVCVFDNDEAKWGKIYEGIPVRPPQELPAMINASTRLIIASVWHIEIANQLENMGLYDYYVFIDGLNYGRK